MRALVSRQISHIRRLSTVLFLYGRCWGTAGRRGFSVCCSLLIFLITYSSIQSVHSTNDRIMSLKPTLFIQKKQEVLDLSGLVNPTFSIQTAAQCQSLSIPFNVTRTGAEAGREVFDPFPERTRGVFYWDSIPYLHPMTDTIRFRLCESIDGFRNGKDLRTTAGLSWGLPLWRVAWHEDWDGLRHLIREEELVPPGFVEGDKSVLSDLNMARDPNPLFSFNQPIVIDVNRWAHSIHLVTRHSMDVFRLSQLFRDKSFKTQPYSG